MNRNAVTLVRSFYDRHVVEVARDLLGKVILRRSAEGLVSGRIVETEAYLAEADSACHSYQGVNRKNATMFGPPGRAYVYFTYGMHWCLNVVTSPPGTGAAVLVRSGEVVQGVETARRRRSRSDGRVPADRDLARGPARLTRVLAVTGEHDGLDLLDPASPLRLHLGTSGGARVAAGPRVGVSAARGRPWRFWLADEPAVSAYRAGGRRRAR